MDWSLAAVSRFRGSIRSVGGARGEDESPRPRGRAKRVLSTTEGESGQAEKDRQDTGGVEMNRFHIDGYCIGRAGFGLSDFR